ncbi:hypothetical protein U3C50_003540 [Providencia rettgeri]|nr:hypothetical protein [Providencia rettgeri]EIJ7168789.1 hypothetical protein [Providencia rettgeri]EMA4783766.1 hypothetical protein [Providencia rettgeri]
MAIPIIITFFIVLALFIATVVSIAEEEHGKAVVLVLVIMLIIGLNNTLYTDKAENVSKGEYYTTQCQLIETNIDNGLFQSNTNKLKCGDVIENVTVDEYQQAIQAYQGSGN